MGIATHKSVVTMPMGETRYATVRAFLCGRFPAIAPELWEQRIADGKVCDEHGSPITRDTVYAGQQRVFYYREVPDEPPIPFAEKILFCDDEILVACKPHFLPVTPGGRYVEECLLQRLRKSTGIADLAPLHRIDRETAGLVLFSVNKKSRGRYGELFLQGRIRKTYLALAACREEQQAEQWQVSNRIERGEPWFRMKNAAGSSNARSTIALVEVRGCLGRFVLHPHTGKTHQLRLHMSSLGFAIMNDRYYPELQAEREDDYGAPLQLIAHALSFKDPLHGGQREFVSERTLLW